MSGLEKVLLPARGFSTPMERAAFINKLRAPQSHVEVVSSRDAPTVPPQRRRLDASDVVPRCQALVPPEIAMENNFPQMAQSTTAFPTDRGSLRPRWKGRR